METGKRFSFSKRGDESAFHRSVRLSAQVEIEYAKADQKKTVLEITLPKVEKTRGKEIKIEVKRMLSLFPR